MKTYKSIYAVILGMPLMMASCHNGDQVFPDFDYQTIYFANQTPVQTITLGEDGEFDNSMDNEHRFQIYATLGGINTNKQNRWVDYRIDNGLVDQITFEDGSPVKALPSSHYTVTSDPSRIFINKGSVMGAIDIQLTDAFFADLETPNVCYVIPVRLTESSDSILNGELKDGITNPSVLNAADWSVAPKNYVLYGIKYKNKYHGTWLSRGSVTTNGVTVTHEDPNGWWENEEIHYLTTKSLNQCVYAFSKAVPVTAADGAAGEEIINVDIILNISDSGDITLSSGTEGVDVSGSGKYTYHGAGNAWGALQRDLIELDFKYSTTYTDNHRTGSTATLEVAVKEKLVSRDRQSKFETFNYVVK